MRDYTDLELEILGELLDDRGHANWEIAEHLKRKDSNVNPILKRLEMDEAIYHGPYRKTTKHDSKRPNQPEIPYYLTRDISEFQLLLNNSVRFDNNLPERILASEYTNIIIDKKGFGAVNDIVGPLLKGPLCKIVSETLLDQISTIEEYKYIIKYIREYLLGNDLSKFDIKDEIKRKVSTPRPIWRAVMGKDDSYYSFWVETGDLRGEIQEDMRSKIKPISFKHMEMLANFDPQRAISFYRIIMHDELRELLSELHNKSLFSLGLCQFMEYDNYLSPFTSYPIHSPRFLLFSRPFQRIYDDFYLLKKQDLSYLDDRVDVIYNYFADFLFEFFRNEHPRNLNLLEDQIKQFIYQWNVASTNYDSVRLYLESVYGYKEGSGKYHVQSKGLEFRITDLETDKQLPDIEKDELYFEALPMIFERPRDDSGSYMMNTFEYIKPCNCFKSSSELKHHLISFNQILSDVKSKFADYGWDYDIENMERNPK